MCIRDSIYRINAKLLSILLSFRQRDEVENMDNCTVTEELQYNERSWYIYVLVSTIVYFIGFFIILVGRVLWKVFKDWQFRLSEEEKDSRKPLQEYKTWYLKLKEFAVNLDTGKSFLGKCLVSTLCISFLTL